MPYSDYETIPQLIAAMMRRSAKLSGWSPPPPGSDSALVGPWMLECLSWEPSQRPTVSQLYSRMLPVYRKEGFNEVRSTVVQQVAVDSIKAKKIRSQGNFSIDTALAFRELERLLT